MRGKEQYIQQKIASICMEKLTELFTPVPASVELGEKSKVIVPGEQGYFVCRFTGVPPWSLTYTVDGEEHRLDSITTNPLIVEVTPTADETTVLPVAVSNRYTESGAVTGEAHIYTGRQSVSSIFDTYVHQANQTTAYTDADHLEVKGNTDTTPAKPTCRLPRPASTRGPSAWWCGPTTTASTPAGPARRPTR